MATPFDVPLDELRRRRSAKWTTFPPDVLPLPVAEMDVRLAPPITAALRTAVDDSDTGYTGDLAPLLAAFAAFARRRWSWPVQPADVRACADVAAGATEVLRLLVAPGDAVVLMPPLYPPVRRWIQAVGARPVAVPLLDPAGAGRLDLDGIAHALTNGARVVFLCHPHNPTGRVHEPAELRALARLAARHDAVVLADEIHAPLTLPGHRFHPYLTVSADAAATGIALHSASKAWNLAGLKCALVVAADPRRLALLARLPDAWAVGHLGVLAATAAYRDAEPWLDTLLDAITGNVELLGELLARHLPEITCTPPEATYLTWLDCRALGLGDDPAAEILRRAKVALSPGPAFGPPGAGFARLNLACHPDLLRDAVTQMSALRPPTVPR